MLKQKIIYSLKIHLALCKRGFNPISVMPNPKKPEFNCWVYERTPALDLAFDEIVRGCDDGSL